MNKLNLIEWLLVIVMIFSLFMAVETGLCPEITSGTVVAKHYIPTKTDELMMPLNNTIMAIPQDEPEQWILTVRGLLHGKSSTVDVNVSADQYKKISIGDTCNLTKKYGTLKLMKK